MRAIKLTFECPVCGNRLNTICLGTTLKDFKAAKEPKRCGCGRKTGFMLADIKFVELEVKDGSD